MVMLDFPYEESDKIFVDTNVINNQRYFLVFYQLFRFCFHFSCESVTLCFGEFFSVGLM
jgi:hypothetical protein